MGIHGMSTAEAVVAIPVTIFLTAPLMEPVLVR
ncbi:hypothetical protein LMG27177_02021 [Paraburkholderia fynbosensis]|uniref:Uncharacterized protein n=1 Tax=Paraburkholderia fynbosensis TaxID=1200993 RepID=A0A6J5FTI0_9BURK|nr:hypothetical protein LMG27177_02021 [Paraburkholderia fynbosensis]